ncbi:hypothetical protein D3C80_1160120 [compost metagenome]
MNFNAGLLIEKRAMPFQCFVITRSIGTEETALQCQRRIEIFALDQCLEIIEAFITFADQSRNKRWVNAINRTTDHKLLRA